METPGILALPFYHAFINFIRLFVIVVQILQL